MVRKIIKKILKEDFDWLEEIPGMPKGVKITGPIKKDNPKNKFKLLVNFGVYDSSGTEWSVDNWGYYDPINDSDRITSDLIILELFAGEDMYDVAENIINIIKNNENKIPVFNKLNYDNNEDGLKDYIVNYLLDSPYLDDEHTVVSNYSLIYFDDNGIEFHCETDLSGLI